MGRNIRTNLMNAVKNLLGNRDEKDFEGLTEDEKQIIRDLREEENKPVRSEKVTFYKSRKHNLNHFRSRVNFNTNLFNQVQ